MHGEEKGEGRNGERELRRDSLPFVPDSAASFHTPSEAVAGANVVLPEKQEEASCRRFRRTKGEVKGNE